MAAPVGSSSGCWSAPEVYRHHEQRRVCISRPKYREGRKAKAVKVYTINLESRYVMIQGVPAIGVMSELIQLCALYGVVEEYRPLDEYPAEEFTEVYLVKFQKLTSARAAKRYMDEKSFYGGVLHVCYVPEYETVEDTRLKLQDRKRYVVRTVQNKAREEEKRRILKEDTVSADLATTSETIITRPDTEKPETSNIGHYYGFPLLPLPPQECPYNPHRGMPKEDKMGTLYTAVTETNPQPISGSSQPSSDRDRSTRQKVNSEQSAAVRFVPRTTQLENRKRKMEEDVEHLSADPQSNNEPLIGPKLPEPPKIDMEDESLNTTMNMIRNTMKKVESVSCPKPVEKKVKPRRRI